MLSCWSGQRLNGSRRTSLHQVGSMHAADTGFLKQCGRAALQCSVLWEQLAAAGPFPVRSGCGDRAGQELGAVRAAECISLPASLPASIPPCLPPSLLKALLPAGTAAHSGLFVALVSCRAPWCPHCAVLDGAVRSSACGCSPSWQRVVLSDFCL